MGSDKDVEPKIYIMFRTLKAYTLDLTVITETKHVVGPMKRTMISTAHATRSSSLVPKTTLGIGTITEWC